MSKSKVFSGSVKFVLIAFFCVTVFLPIFMMFSKIKWDTVSSFVFTQQFAKTVQNSLSVTIISTVISVLLAYILAFAINRSRIPCKGAISVLLALPMLIPSISHGMGLINIFGENGIFTKLFGINIGLTGFTGIVLGSILYSFPIAFLMLSDAMKYADATMYESAKVLGIPTANTFFAVTMQYMKRPLISATFAVFTMIFTDYGVPLAVGGRFTTLPV
ncbi:MAG: ABC transporter permease subunit, partial [Oscillospiraceae bacterium]